MPSNLSNKDLDELIEELLQLRNRLIELGSDRYAGAANRAVRAIDELRRLIKAKATTSGVTHEKE